MHFLRALRRPQLALLWIGQVCSAVGDQIFMIALIWLSVKQIGSATGLITAVGTITMLTCGLLGGALADRWNRRVTMIVVDLLRAALVGVLPVLALLGVLSFWALLPVFVLLEALGSLFDPALQASLPALAPDPQTLQTTNSLMDMTRRIARILGPGLAGLLLVSLPIFHFFTLDALSFGVSALSILALGSRYAWRPASSSVVRTGASSLLSEIGIALRLVWGHRPLFWGLASLGISNLTYSAVFILGAPLLIAQTLHGDVGAYGLIVAAYGLGNVASSLLIGSLTIKRRLRLLFLGKLLLGLGFLSLAVASTLRVALLGAAIAALGGPMGDLMLLTIIQLELPPEHIGKVFSLEITISSIGATFGFLLGTVVFAFLPLRAAIVLFSLPLVLIGVLGMARARRDWL